MNAYQGMVLSIFIWGILFQGEKNRKKLVFLLFFSMFIVYGLRNTYVIGGDSSSSYLHQFQAIFERELDPRNFGWQLLMRFFSFLFKGDYQIFISSISLFVMVAYAKLVGKYSVSPFLSVMWYLGMLYFTFHFSALKQSVAMGVLCYAFDAMMDRRPIKFILLTCLASFFHFPALVFLPCYLLPKIEVKYYFATLGLVLIIVFLFRDQIVSFMSGFYYEEGWTITTENRFLSNKALIMFLIIGVSLLVRRPDADGGLYHTLVLMMGIAVVFQTFCAYNNIFERLADYYYQFSILFMPLIFEPVENQRSILPRNYVHYAQLFGPAVITVFSVWRLLTMVVGNAALFPYYFLWEDPTIYL